MSGENGHKLAHHFHRPPQRVVSLVPSLTESLFDLGFGSAVVGITDYCVHPSEALRGLPRLGGPKNPRVDEIIALKPDLVLANQEENTRHTVEALEAAGVFVWVTFPCTVAQALDILWTLVGLFQSQTAAMQLQGLEMALEWARNAARQQPPVRYFCPIWYEKRQDGQPWWMTFNRQTYAHDLLATLGGENVFAARERRYPLEADLGLAEAQPPRGRDTRYPRLSLEEVRTVNPEVILLPNEPFAFSEIHRQELLSLLKETSAVQQGRVHLVDGSLITWHGTRLGRALQVLPSLLSS
jgi:ABC-type Fe3+-hydroxamate transport system substrate-binding protein